MRNVKRGALLQVNADIPIPEQLNKSQRRAVEAALELCMCGIQGPPGTGKTSVLTCIALAYLIIKDNMSWETRNIQTLASGCELDADMKMKPTNKVGVVCSTNSAADNCALAFKKTGTKKVFLRVGTAPEDLDIKKLYWVGTLKLTKKNGEPNRTPED